MTEPPAGQPTEPTADAPPAPRRAPDPRRGLRGVMAAALLLQALAVALAFPVVVKVGADAAAGGRLPSVWVGVAIVAVLVAVLLAAAGLQRRSWGRWFAVGIQVAMLACAPLMPAIAILGVLFGLVWAYLLWLRHDLERRLAAATSTS